MAKQLRDIEAIQSLLVHRPLAVFSDIDGTLAPIVPDPLAARVADGAREALRDLMAQGVDVGLITGRDLTMAREMTGLPDACCDVILLRLVYHHFVRPEEMRASLRNALRPGGLIAVIDVAPQTTWRDLPEVPDRGGHGIPPEDLIDEMTSDGFEVVDRRENWNGEEDRFCVIFRR